MRLRAVLLQFFVALVPLHASAGAFKVFPLKLELDPGQKTSSVRLVNTDKRDISVQLEGAQWGQSSEGVDQYLPTKDILFFPKIVTLKAGDEALIRIAYQGVARRGVEGTYRLFAQEIPDRAGGSGLNFALRLGIPVFIKPARDDIKGVLAALTLDEGRLRVPVGNHGTRHFLVSRIRVRGVDAHAREVFMREVSGWYVLPGVTRQFNVDVPVEECRRSRELQVAVAFAAVERHARLDVSATGCQAPGGGKL